MHVATWDFHWPKQSDTDVSIPGGFSCTLRPSSSPELARSLAWFQSLAGFLARCDLRQWLSRALPGTVSIPGGFSCTLRPFVAFAATSTTTCFNPWRVFLHVATTDAFGNKIATIGFQSLAGFLARCDAIKAAAEGATPAGFQSLAGFLARCDGIWGNGWPLPGHVSIPGGFSCTLRQIRRYQPHRSGGMFQSLAGFLARCDRTIFGRWHAKLVVSIPGGFSCTLRHDLHFRKHSMTPEFQSLAGFLARCDASLCYRYKWGNWVSIPGGFSCTLRHLQ